MKKTTLFLPIVLLVFTNCAPTLELNKLHPKPTVTVERVTDFSENASYTLEGKVYQFPRKVEEIQYFPQWQQMTVNFLLDRRQHAYGIYDLDEASLKWANRGNYYFSLLKKEVALVQFQDKKVLLDAESSLPIRWVNKEELAVIDDSITINLGEQFARIDLETGRKYWIRSGTNRFDGWLTDELDGEWMYVVADGLHGFNIRTGKGWYQPVKTNYDASRGGRALANGLMFGLNVLTTIYGGYEAFPYLEPQRAHNVFAKPKIVGDDLYFADRKTIYCLNKRTGESYWEQTLDEELGVSKLDMLSNQELLVLGKGYRYVNYALDKDRQATLFSVDVDNGRILNQHFFKREEIIINHAINDAFVYILSDGRVFQFDYDLTLLESINIPFRYGKPMRVVTWSSSRYDEDLKTDIPDFPLVIRTTEGVLALHPVTLEELWYKRLGMMRKDLSTFIPSDEKWQIPILMEDTDQRRSWVDEETETFWFATTGKIIGLDLINDGATVAEFEFSSDDFWYVGNGELVQFGGSEVKLLRLQKN